MVNEKIACVILAIGDRYKKLSTVAFNSFKKFHPNIETILVNDENKEEYFCSKQAVSAGIMKYMIAYEIMIRKNKNKVIILGSDTITCDYLSEFVDNDYDDILATLDYPYVPSEFNFYLPNNDSHVNADVVCFNNKEALLDCVQKSFDHNVYFEQGGLNEVIWKEKKYKTKIVDGPYSESRVIYNVRAKGNIIAAPYTKPWKPYIDQYRVNDNKLYSFDNKQIKVFHYCEGFGTMNKESFLEIMNLWIFDWFNQQTKDFFKNCCDTGTFFEEKYDY